MSRILLFLFIHCTFLFKLYTCILGGAEVQVGAVPYQVALFDGNTFICSGSLVSKQWILTAAECVKNSGVNSLRVKLGATNIAQKEAFAVEEKIKSIIIHPKYEDTIQNNIALIMLKRPVTFTHTIASIPIGNISDLDGKSVHLSGWGKTGLLYPKSSVLHQVNLTVMSNSGCSSAFLIFLRTITAKDMCTHGNLFGGSGACHSDIGAPLVLKDKQNIQVGIASATTCIMIPPVSLPTVYVRVSKYKKWIDSHIRKPKRCSRKKSERNTEGPPTEEPGEERPTEGPGDERPTEEPEEERPTEEPGDERPTEEPREERPTEKPKESPTEEPRDERPMEEPEKERPTEEPGDERPTEKPGEGRPTEEPGEKRPTEEPGEKREKEGKEVTEKKTGQVVEEIVNEKKKKIIEVSQVNM